MFLTVTLYLYDITPRDGKLQERERERERDWRGLQTRQRRFRTAIHHKMFFGEFNFDSAHTFGMNKKYNFNRPSKKIINRMRIVYNT